MKPFKAYTIYLSCNMYSDVPKEKYLYSKDYPMEYYYLDKCIAEPDTFRLLCDEAKKADIDTLVVFAGDGVRYDSHPEIALPGAWSKKELVSCLEYARSLELELVPHLNFSAARDVWMGEYSRMVSTDEYYAFCADMIKETCEIFLGPKYFHLGMDDEYMEYQLKYDYMAARGDKLFIHDLKFLVEQCRKCGATPWVSCDFAHEYSHLFKDAVDEDIPVVGGTAVWNNMHGSKPKPESEKISLKAVAGMGYGLICNMSCWSNSSGPEYVTSFAKNNLPKDQIKGFAITPFLVCCDENKHKLIYEILHGVRAINDFGKEA